MTEDTISIGELEEKMKHVEKLKEMPYPTSIYELKVTRANAGDKAEGTVTFSKAHDGLPSEKHRGPHDVELKKAQRECEEKIREALIEYRRRYADIVGIEV